jgi:hypothetical protein
VAGKGLAADRYWRLHEFEHSFFSRDLFKERIFVFIASSRHFFGFAS